MMAVTKEQKKKRKKKNNVALLTIPSSHDVVLGMLTFNYLLNKKNSRFFFLFSRLNYSIRCQIATLNH